MQRYLLYQSKEESSYTFIAESHMAQANLLPDDARLIWQTEADSWEIACMKKHEFLDWEPYKPLITDAKDLRALLPKHKHDLENLQLLMNLGWPTIEPVLPELLEWIQDMNWPVAQKLAPFLADLGRVLLLYLGHIFNSDDGMWKYWLITRVLMKMNRENAEPFRELMENTQENPSQEDRACGIPEAVSEFLLRIK